MDDIGPGLAHHPGDRTLPANKAADIPTERESGSSKSSSKASGRVGSATTPAAAPPRRHPFARRLVAIGLRNWRTVPETVAT